jgi:two-component system sensor kinase FixL
MPLAGQYRALFDNALEAIAVIDVQGIIQSANPAMEQVFGYEPFDLVGQNIEMPMPGAAARRHDECPQEDLRTGVRDVVSLAGEAEGRRKDGTTFPLEVALAEWQRDGATFFTSLMRDITGREESDAMLANREAHLANLYALSGAGLAETDSNGRFVSVNDRYCEIVGRSREELLQLRLLDITWPEARPHTVPLFERLAASDGPVLLDERYVRGDGSSVWVTKTASPIRIDNNEPIALVVAIDVTERKEADAMLRASEERLQVLQSELAHIARINDLGEMAVAIAHEINQPLAAIANYLTAGRMHVANETTAAALAAAREAMAQAEGQALRAGKIVHGLREFARKGQGTRHVVPADSLVDSAMAMALIGIRDTGITLRHELAGDSALVEVDAVQIEQVLMNLLRNAIDALVTNAPGAPRSLTIVTRDLPAEGVVEFCVSDTGPGIAPDICDRLFQPFVTTKPAGMGMGLSVCRRIVETHGGAIEVDCDEGIGATFRIMLPRHCVAPQHGLPIP